MSCDNCINAGWTDYAKKHKTTDCMWDYSTTFITFKDDKYILTATDVLESGAKTSTLKKDDALRVFYEKTTCSKCPKKENMSRQFFEHVEPSSQCNATKDYSWAQSIWTSISGSTNQSKKQKCYICSNPMDAGISSGDAAAVAGTKKQGAKGYGSQCEHIFPVVQLGLFTLLAFQNKKSNPYNINYEDYKKGCGVSAATINAHFKKCKIFWELLYKYSHTACNYVKSDNLFIEPMFEYSNNDPKLTIIDGKSWLEQARTNPKRLIIKDNIDATLDQVWDGTRADCQTLRSWWLTKAAASPISLFRQGGKKTAINNLNKTLLEIIKGIHKQFKGAIAAAEQEILDFHKLSINIMNYFINRKLQYTLTSDNLSKEYQPLQDQWKTISPTGLANIVNYDYDSQRNKCGSDSFLDLFKTERFKNLIGGANLYSMDGVDIEDEGVYTIDDDSSNTWGISPIKEVDSLVDMDDTGYFINNEFWEYINKVCNGDVLGEHMNKITIEDIEKGNKGILRYIFKIDKNIRITDQEQEEYTYSKHGDAANYLGYSIYITGDNERAKSIKIINSRNFTIEFDGPIATNTRSSVQALETLAATMNDYLKSRGESIEVTHNEGESIKLKVEGIPFEVFYRFFLTRTIINFSKYEEYMTGEGEDLKLVHGKHLNNTDLESWLTDPTNMELLSPKSPTLSKRKSKRKTRRIRKKSRKKSRKSRRSSRKKSKKRKKQRKTRRK